MQEYRSLSSCLGNILNGQSGRGVPRAGPLSVLSRRNFAVRNDRFRLLSSPSPSAPATFSTCVLRPTNPKRFNNNNNNMLIVRNYPAEEGRVDGGGADIA